MDSGGNEGVINLRGKGGGALGAIQGGKWVHGKGLAHGSVIRGSEIDRAHGDPYIVDFRVSADGAIALLIKEGQVWEDMGLICLGPKMGMGEKGEWLKPNEVYQNDYRYIRTGDAHVNLPGDKQKGVKAQGPHVYLFHREHSKGCGQGGKSMKVMAGEGPFICDDIRFSYPPKPGQFLHYIEFETEDGKPVSEGGKPKYTKDGWPVPKYEGLKWEGDKYAIATEWDDEKEESVPTEEAKKLLENGDIEIKDGKVTKAKLAAKLQGHITYDYCLGHWGAVKNGDMNCDILKQKTFGRKFDSWTDKAGFHIDMLDGDESVEVYKFGKDGAPIYELEENGERKTDEKTGGPKQATEKINLKKHIKDRIEKAAERTFYAGYETAYKTGKIKKEVKEILNKNPAVKFPAGSDIVEGEGETEKRYKGMFYYNESERRWKLQKYDKGDEKCEYVLSEKVISGYVEHEDLAVTYLTATPQNIVYGAACEKAGLVYEEGKNKATQRVVKTEMFLGLDKEGNRMYLAFDAQENHWAVRTVGRHHGKVWGNGAWREAVEGEYAQNSAKRMDEKGEWVDPLDHDRILLTDGAGNPIYKSFTTGVLRTNAMDDAAGPFMQAWTSWCRNFIDNRETVEYMLNADPMFYYSDAFTNRSYGGFHHSKGQFAHDDSDNKHTHSVNGDPWAPENLVQLDGCRPSEEIRTLGQICRALGSELRTTTAGEHNTPVSLGFKAASSCINDRKIGWCKLQKDAVAYVKSAGIGLAVACAASAALSFTPLAFPLLASSFLAGLGNVALSLAGGYFGGKTFLKNSAVKGLEMERNRMLLNQELEMGRKVMDPHENTLTGTLGEKALKNDFEQWFNGLTGEVFAKTGGKAGQQELGTKKTLLGSLAIALAAAAGAVAIFPIAVLGTGSAIAAGAMGIGALATGCASAWNAGKEWLSERGFGTFFKYYFEASTPKLVDTVSIPNLARNPAYRPWASTNAWDFPARLGKFQELDTPAKEAARGRDLYGYRDFVENRKRFADERLRGFQKLDEEAILSL